MPPKDRYICLKTSIELQILDYNFMFWERKGCSKKNLENHVSFFRNKGWMQREREVQMEEDFRRKAELQEQTEPLFNTALSA